MTWRSCAKTGRCVVMQTCECTCVPPCFRFPAIAHKAWLRPVASSESSKSRQAGAMGAPAYLPSIYEVAEVKVRLQCSVTKEANRTTGLHGARGHLGSCLQIKKVVYKNRIRLKEFFVDFDKVANPLQPPFSGNLCKQKACMLPCLHLASEKLNRSRS